MTAITAPRATTVQPPGIEAELARADPALGRVIAAVIARIGQQRIKPSRAPPLEALARAVIYQSVSEKAAVAIFARLKEMVGGLLAPAKILAMPQGSMMAAGISKSKADAIRNLAAWFAAMMLSRP
jgi:DNA-3-methyladenine glycosylase II